MEMGNRVDEGRDLIHIAVIRQPEPTKSTPTTR